MKLREARPFSPPWPQIELQQQQWRQQLPKNQELVLEIGAGVGLHPLQYAINNPAVTVVAIEKTTEKYNKMWQRFLQHGSPPNLVPIHANAIQWIWQNILPGEVNQVFILYPNPYPKAAQSNKRFMHMPFMQYLLETLRPNGKLVLATNDNNYYQQAKDKFSDFYGLKVFEDQVVNHSIAGRTHFERKYLSRGESCFNLVVVKS